MTSDRIAVIGTDLISASIAFGLQEREQSIELIGYDSDPAVADLAKVRGAFDDVRRKPGPTCEGAKLVIVAQPLVEIERIFAAISPYLEEGVVVTDTARLKAPVVRWASDLLPKHALFVGGHLILNPGVVGLRTLEGLEDASADLLRNALFCFTPTPTTASEAIDMCSWLAYAVQASPFFIDVKEHDGLLASVEGLPDLVTIALLRATVDTPGWEEMRKFAGRRFANATGAVDDMSARRPSLFLNRKNVIQRLDTLIEELTRLRTVLIQGDEEALTEILVEAAEGRARWMDQRRKGMWAEDGAFDTRDIPGAAGQLGRMLFGNLASRLRRGPDDSRED